ncbi:MAG: hypothetical protein DMF63_01295 [Acidobacteria bacterium]|nr:MAG: hypothetical protein DMF63_01295 [Acidobacteriota bacterium]
MKLRIKGNSIRLRLLKSEVEKFANEGFISDETNFGASTLRYTLRMSNGSDAIEGKFDANEIAVLIPEQVARDWTANSSVGFEIEQQINADERLTIIVEKDFVCIDRHDDPDRDDAYPNPNLNC